MVGGVRDGQIAVLAELVGEEVVQDAPVLLGENAVLRAVLGDLAHVVGEDPLEERLRVGSRRLDLAHVADVEDPRIAAHVRCSSLMPAYCTGISHPANGTSFAPAATCRSYSGVRLSVSVSAAISGPDPSASAPLKRAPSGYSPSVRRLALLLIASFLVPAAPARAGTYDVVAVQRAGRGRRQQRLDDRNDGLRRLRDRTPDDVAFVRAIGGVRVGLQISPRAGHERRDLGHRPDVRLRRPDRNHDRRSCALWRRSAAVARRPQHGGRGRRSRGSATVGSLGGPFGPDSAIRLRGPSRAPSGRPARQQTPSPIRPRDHRAPLGHRVRRRPRGIAGCDTGEARHALGFCGSTAVGGDDPRRRRRRSSSSSGSTARRQAGAAPTPTRLLPRPTTPASARASAPDRRA